MLYFLLSCCISFILYFFCIFLILLLFLSINKFFSFVNYFFSLISCICCNLLFYIFSLKIYIFNFIITLFTSYILYLYNIVSSYKVPLHFLPIYIQLSKFYFYLFNIFIIFSNYGFFITTLSKGKCFYFISKSDMQLIVRKDTFTKKNIESLEKNGLVNLDLTKGSSFISIRFLYKIRYFITYVKNVLYTFFTFFSNLFYIVLNLFSYITNFIKLVLFYTYRCIRNIYVYIFLNIILFVNNIFFKNNLRYFYSFNSSLFKVFKSIYSYTKLNVFGILFKILYYCIYLFSIIFGLLFIKPFIKYIFNILILFDLDLFVFEIYFNLILSPYIRTLLLIISSLDPTSYIYVSILSIKIALEIFKGFIYFFISGFFNFVSFVIYTPYYSILNFYYNSEFLFSVSTFFYNIVEDTFLSVFYLLYNIKLNLYSLYSMVFNTITLVCYTVFDYYYFYIDYLFYFILVTFGFIILFLKVVLSQKMSTAWFCIFWGLIDEIYMEEWDTTWKKTYNTKDLFNNETEGTYRLYTTPKKELEAFTEMVHIGSKLPASVAEVLEDKFYYKLGWIPSDIGPLPTRETNPGVTDDEIWEWWLKDKKIEEQSTWNDWLEDRWKRDMLSLCLERYRLEFLARRFDTTIEELRQSEKCRGIPDHDDKNNAQQFEIDNSFDYYEMIAIPYILKDYLGQDLHQHRTRVIDIPEKYKIYEYRGIYDEEYDFFRHELDPKRSLDFYINYWDYYDQGGREIDTGLFKDIVLRLSPDLTSDVEALDMSPIDIISDGNIDSDDQPEDFTFGELIVGSRSGFFDVDGSSSFNNPLKVIKPSEVANHSSSYEKFKLSLRRSMKLKNPTVFLKESQYHTPTLDLFNYPEYNFYNNYSVGLIPYYRPYKGRHGFAEDFIPSGLEPVDNPYPIFSSSNFTTNVFSNSITSVLRQESLWINVSSMDLKMDRHDSLMSQQRYLTALSIGSMGYTRELRRKAFLKYYIYF